MKKTALILLSGVAALLALMAVFPEAATRTLFSIERQLSGLSAETVVVDNETWHYLEGGADDAPTLLLLHGFGGDKDNWTRFSRALVADYRIIAPDLPGFGDSARHSDWDYSLGAQLTRLEHFVAALELGPLHVGGNSMGGHLAALYAHANPGQVRSLLLFNNAGIDSPEPSEMMLAVGRGENPLVVSSPEDFDRLLDLVSYKAPFLPWPVRGVLADKAFLHAAFNDDIFTSLMNNYIALEPLLGDIEQPVFILWGDYDRVLDVSSIDVMQPLLPQAKVVVMPDTGHIPMLERPAATAAHTAAFLAGLAD